MNDRELLELAAKAAFSDCANLKYPLYWVRDRVGDWNPLADDGDALRLAVRLELTVNCSNWCARSASSLHWHDGGRDDHMSATRRAIVRAAAEIGRAMK